MPNIASNSLPPTHKQLAYLRNLAQHVGQTFTTPHTRLQASAEIRRLQAIRNTGFTFAELEAARDATDDAPCAVHAFEIAGHGASTTWSQRS